MKTLLLFLLITFNSITSNASECYQYHTPHYFDLYVKKGQLIFQHTVKDPNKISYVSRNEIILEKINTKDFKIISKDAKLILFSTVDGYYIAEKDWHEIKEYGVTKIYSLHQVTKTAGTSYFYSDDKWVYIDLENYSSTFNKKNLPKLSSNLEIFDKDDNNRRWLLKDDYNFYAFTDVENFKIIPNLDVKTTKLYKTESNLEENFLYDDDTFYRINYNYDYEDMKPNFDIFNKHNGFLQFKFYDLDVLYIKATNDNLIWAYIKSGMSLDNDERVYFHPLKNAAFLNKTNSLLTIDGRIYFDSHNAIFQNNSLDISLVKDLSNLQKIDFSLYNDGVQSYRFDYDLHKLLPTKNKLSSKAILHKEINSYRSYTYPFYNDEGTLKFRDDKNKIRIKRKIKSKVKFLELAYAYDNILLIEDQEIISLADFETLAFLGSTVDVIEPCDDKGQTNIDIKYYYFFKDKDNIYSYYSGENKIKTLDNINPKNYIAADYNQLKNLEKRTQN